MGLAERVVCGKFFGTLDQQTQILQRIGGEAPGQDRSHFREIVGVGDGHVDQRLAGLSIAGVVAQSQLALARCNQSALDRVDGIRDALRVESCLADEFGGFVLPVSSGQEVGHSERSHW